MEERKRGNEETELYIYMNYIYIKQLNSQQTYKRFAAFQYEQTNRKNKKNKRKIRKKNNNN